MYTATATKPSSKTYHTTLNNHNCAKCITDYICYNTLNNILNYCTWKEWIEFFNVFINKLIWHLGFIFCSLTSAIIHNIYNNIKNYISRIHLISFHATDSEVALFILILASVFTIFINMPITSRTESQYRLFCD